MSNGFTYEVLKDVDPKAFDELYGRLSKLNKAVYVGYPAAGEGDGNAPTEEADGTPLAAIATYMEFGVPEKNIPERPFMRMTFKAHKQDYIEYNKKALVSVLHGKITVEKALGILGTMAVGHIQQMIKAGDFAADSPATVKRKGSSKPLIDTGQLWQGITYEIRGKDDA